jgi:UDP-N-acetylglucosamine diphosphorylase / glucose-1-phosphate thymidylyltransferase / UDP-N-acetylgalactosamine diphosphorylase / glucosamine-1-phosphate N-acetyltransferase / galactosamine-1-phosphate N-acetyltransferase
MAEVNLVICMAGYNTRFHDVGFDIPKYLLPWNGTTIIHDILQNFGEVHQTVLVANKRDVYFKDQLLDTIKPLGLEEKNILYIGDTKGQAHTAAVGIGQLYHPELQTFIHNADTIVKGRSLDLIADSMNDMYDAYIDVFVGNSPKYSYVRAFEDTVLEIVEKKQISPYASSGLYGFLTASMYMGYYDSLIQKDHELYIADVIQNMIGAGRKAFMNGLGNNQETIVLGSPQEYGIEIARQTLGAK